MRYSMKSTTAEYRRLDIRDLERKRLLQPTGWTTLFWTVNGERDGSIAIFPHFDHVVMKYSYRHSGGDWQKKEYGVLVRLYSVHLWRRAALVRLSGSRLWAESGDSLPSRDLRLSALP